MKFDRQRLHNNSNDRIQANDPQFLTFRNSPNPLENTGRSVYSQPFDYKSLDKYSSKYQVEVIEQTPQNYRKNFKNMRSQQKYRQIRDQILSKDADQNLEMEISHQTKKQILNKKLMRLIKNIKKQQRRQISLEKEIQEIERNIEQNNEELANQANNISQLKQIFQDNSNDYDNLNATYQQIYQKNTQLTSRIEAIEDSIQSNQISIQTSRQQDSLSKSYHQGVKEGFVQLQQLHQQTLNRAARIEEEIKRMKEMIQQIQSIDQDWKSIHVF